jgi:hypothetical protein
MSQPTRSRSRSSGRTRAESSGPSSPSSDPSPPAFASTVAVRVEFCAKPRIPDDAPGPFVWAKAGTAASAAQLAEFPIRSWEPEGELSGDPDHGAVLAQHIRERAAQALAKAEATAVPKPPPVLLPMGAAATALPKAEATAFQVSHQVLMNVPKTPPELPTRAAATALPKAEATALPKAEATAVPKAMGAAAPKTEGAALPKGT